MPSYYEPLVYKGKRLTGAAAMNARIKRAGDLDQLIEKVMQKTAESMARELGFAEKSPPSSSRPVNRSRNKDDSRPVVH